MQTGVVSCGQVITAIVITLLLMESLAMCRIFLLE
jgi:hypothetical protein